VFLPNNNSDYFRLPVDQLYNTDIDLSWTTSSETRTSQHNINRQIIGESNVNKKQSRKLISTSSSSSFDENLPTVDNRTTQHGRDEKYTHSQFPGGIDDILKINAASNHAPRGVANRNTFASLPLSDNSSFLITDTALDDVDLKEFSLFARRPVRATRSLPYDDSPTSASESATAEADKRGTHASTGDEVTSINRSRIPIRVQSLHSSSAPKTDSQFPMDKKFEPIDGLYERLGESFDVMGTSLTTDELEQVPSSLPFSLPSAPSLDFGSSMASSYNPQFSLTDMWKQLNVSSSKASLTDEMMSGFP
jgi:hypothetical protein